MVPDRSSFLEDREDFCARHRWIGRFKNVTPDYGTTTMPVLGHSALATGQRHYSQVSSVRAAKRLQAVVAALREE
jgi:hypothetical protein